jgi:hypothetical protein
MRKRRYYRKCIFVLLAVLILNTLTYANIIYDFHIFNNQKYENDPGLNFTLTITNEGFWCGKQRVGFRFDNNSAISSSITDIYFDARPDTGSSLLLNNISIIEGPDVFFSKSASPTTLPGGGMLTPRFDRTPEYSADSDSPISPNGINPNEWLKLIFTLKYNRTIDDVIAEIAAGGSCTENNLRVGIHIQSLPKDNYGPCCHTHCCCYDSASAINCTQPIPEPATMAVLALGIAALPLSNRRKRR